MKSHKKRIIKISLLICFLILVLSVGGIYFIFRPYSIGSPPQIPSGWGAKKAVYFIGSEARINKIEIPPNPQNPYLAATNSSNMHVDSFASDVHTLGGPLGINPVVKSYAHGKIGGECACITFDKRGNILAVCSTLSKFSLLLLAQSDLTTLARLDLPPRASNKTMNLRKIMNDTSGGAYFFLDNNDRVVLVDADQKLKIISQQWNLGKPKLVIEKEIDLLPILKEHNNSKDVITAVLPDWQGRYWFVSRLGLIGMINMDTNNIDILKLEGEEIQNSFAIDEDGVYVVSDYALYGIAIDKDTEKPKVLWREEYERAKHKKKGSINLGSGTTPTLIGEKYVAIADNAEPRINVLVYRRNMNLNTNRLVCKIPVFKEGKSAAENSFIGIGNSIIVENNYGYDLFINMMFGKTSEGGVTRIDFNENGDYEIKWHNPIKSQTTVAKLSLETGLVYVYAKDSTIGNMIDAYYLSAIDFETGKTIFQVLAGTGVSYDNNWAPITLGPDRSAYIGVLRGLVKVADGGISD